MNDLAFFRALRKLPLRYLRPGLDVSRFGEGARGVIVASNGAAKDSLPTLVYKGGRWEKDNQTGPTRR